MGQRDERILVNEPVQYGGHDEFAQIDRPGIAIGDDLARAGLLGRAKVVALVRSLVRIRRSRRRITKNT